MDQLMNQFVSSRDLINWQTAMSNSAHQREVADLKAAGLNPVLSAHTNGASTPSGSSDDLGTLMSAMASSVENTGKAVASLAKKEEKADLSENKVWETIGNVMQGFGLKWMFNGATSAYNAIAEHIENNPEVFDEKWRHHHVDANPSRMTDDEYKAEKDYRTTKKQELRNKIKKWLHQTPTSAYNVEGGT